MAIVNVVRPAVWVQVQLDPYVARRRTYRVTAGQHDIERFVSDDIVVYRLD